jgi:hypothetical protein
MPAPWVLNIVTELLRDPSEDLSSSSDLPSSPVFIPPSGRPRVVQVLKVYSNNNIIIVNDKKHSVAVFLSNDCVDSFVKNSNQNLSSIESSMIKLERWHFSTTIQCLGECIRIVLAKVLLHLYYCYSLLPVIFPCR